MISHPIKEREPGEMGFESPYAGMTFMANGAIQLPLPTPYQETAP